jgi:hypothetical protein
MVEEAREKKRCTNTVTSTTSHCCFTLIVFSIASTIIPVVQARRWGMSSIKDMVEYIAKSLADRPDEVEVSESMGESVVMIELNVASEDMGRMIGRKGRTINAIRSVARVLGGKMNKKVSVEIV